MVLRALDRLVSRLHPFEHLTIDKHSGVVGQVSNAIHVGGSPNVIDAFEDGMMTEPIVDNTARAFLAVIAVVADPGVAENLLAEAAGPLLTAPVPLRVAALFVALELEGV